MQFVFVYHLFSFTIRKYCLFLYEESIVSLLITSRYMAYQYTTFDENNRVSDFFNGLDKVFSLICIGEISKA